MRYPIRALLFSLAALTASEVWAMPWYGSDFSAQIVTSDPENPANKAEGKLYVGNGWVRAEGTHNGETKVLLLNPTQGQAWTMLPGKQQFHKGMGNAPMPPMPDEDMMPFDPESPCALGAQQGVVCKSLGMEDKHGRQAEKWEVTISRKDKTMSTTLWVDKGLRIVLGSRNSAGVSKDRRLVGEETLNGRPVEKWEVMTTYEGKSQLYTQWVDRALKVAVRIEGDGKLLGELTNIQAGPQDGNLFGVPANYQEIQPPQPPQQPQQPQQQGR